VNLKKFIDEDCSHILNYVSNKKPILRRLLSKFVSQKAMSIVLFLVRTGALTEIFSSISTTRSLLDANQMVMELSSDHSILVKDLNRAVKIAQENNDEGTITLLGDCIATHEKAHWMLQTSVEL